LQGGLNKFPAFMYLCVSRYENMPIPRCCSLPGVLCGRVLPMSTRPLSWLPTYGIPQKNNIVTAVVCFAPAV
jgi:hypothetical protein